jgi:hypothetical protein
VGLLHDQRSESVAENVYWNYATDEEVDYGMQRLWEYVLDY